MEVDEPQINYQLIWVDNGSDNQKGLKRIKKELFTDVDAVSHSALPLATPLANRDSLVRSANDIGKSLLLFAKKQSIFLPHTPFTTPYFGPHVISLFPPPTLPQVDHLNFNSGIAHALNRMFHEMCESPYILTLEEDWEWRTPKIMSDKDQPRRAIQLAIDVLKHDAKVCASTGANSDAHLL